MRLVDGSVIEVRGLRKVFGGDVVAVAGADFSVSRGEVFGLLGPNGAGKSTTVGMLTTTILPSAGSATLAGFDVVADALAARSVSSVVFQEPVVDAALSGRAHLDMHARLWGIDAGRAGTRADELVAALGLAEIIDRPVGTYSGGQRRRLEIARALVSEPEVLFLDEPTVGLDPRIRHELLDVIAALRLCDRVAIMHSGRVVALDTPARLLAGLGDEILELRVDADAAGALAALRGRGLAGDAAFAVGSTLTLPLAGRNAGDVLAALDALGLRARGITSRAPTLDDVYLHFTGAAVPEAA